MEGACIDETVASFYVAETWRGEPPWLIFICKVEMAVLHSEIAWLCSEQHSVHSALVEKAGEEQNDVSME